MRSVLREFAGVFDAERLAHVRQELRWLQDATGPTRDYDVYVQDFDELLALTPETLHADYEPLMNLLIDRRASARAEMQLALQSPRAAALRGALGELVTDPGGGELAARPITELTAARIRHLHHRMVRMGSRIDADAPPHDYHQLRKRGKELRYLLELFGR
jgi:CHAD domain-containing protein